MHARELAWELLLTAKSDLKALEHMQDRQSFDEAVFGFHAQQAAEKALKSWLVCAGRTPPFTHDLSLLLDVLEEQGENVDSYWDLLELSGYAVRFRYEMIPEGEEPLDRERLARHVRELIAHVERLFH